jgi:serine/threonine protein kinase
MGTVYRALDIKLDRAVALKFLPSDFSRDPSAKDRFIREAKAASSLQHKNICVVYDIDETEDGQLFISMECLEGATLARQLEGGPLALEEAVHIASHVAQGLAKAHANGIVHRDITPTNIFVTSDHQAKILDFGLAQSPVDGILAGSDFGIGTVSYMSPEQVQGVGVDHRTDIWSLGVVFHEMITGRRPFDGTYNQAVMYSIIHEEHRMDPGLRRDLPPAVPTILDRCLAKSPENRYHAADDLVAALQQVRTGAGPRQKTDIKSIAVLPFSDISPDGDNLYFSNGLTEEIIAKLSKLRRVRIISRASVMSYHREGKTVKQIADELQVQFLVEGSVRKHGSLIRITAHLIDADQDAYLWAETYDGTMTEVFDIQENVASRVAKALRVRVTPGETKTLKQRATVSTEAFQLYLKGRFFWNKRNQEGMQAAIRCFEEAIALDAHYALAWAGIADSYNLMSEYVDTARRDMHLKAMDAIHRALALDNKLAEAHASLGLILMLDEWNWAGSKREFTKAIRLDPTYPTAHHWYAEWLSMQGREKEALEEITLAIELDPLAPAILKDKGVILYYTRDFKGAMDYARKSQELYPQFAATHRLFSLAYSAMGLHDQAMAENDRWGALGASNIDVKIGRAYCYAAAGRRSEALELVRPFELERPANGNLMRGIALVFAALGDANQAFEWFERAYVVKAESLGSLKIDPKVDPLRSDPRLANLIGRVGLPL